jgi:hypothetical protein
MANDQEFDPALEEASDQPTSMQAIIADGVVGAIGGFTGTAIMTVVLLVASTVGGFDMNSFATLAELVGADAILGEEMTVAVGYFIFLGGGMTTWPLLFASLGSFLPGEQFATKGLPFGFVLWTGFSLAFYDGRTGLALVLYLVFTLVAHLVYGFALGSVFDYLSKRTETLV